MVVGGNVIFTDELLKKTTSEKTNFHWLLALTALKNYSTNSFRTTNIECLCTSAFCCKFETRLRMLIDVIV